MDIFRNCHRTLNTTVPQAGGALISFFVSPAWTVPQAVFAVAEGREYLTVDTAVSLNTKNWRPAKCSASFNVDHSRTLNPFRTAVPLWGQTTQISSSLSPKRDCGSKRVKSRWQSRIMIIIRSQGKPQKGASSIPTPICTPQKNKVARIDVGKSPTIIIPGTNNYVVSTTGTRT